MEAQGSLCSVYEVLAELHLGSACDHGRLRECQSSHQLSVLSHDLVIMTTDVIVWRSVIRFEQEDCETGRSPSSCVTLLENFVSCLADTDDVMRFCLQGFLNIVDFNGLLDRMDRASRATQT